MLMILNPRQDLALESLLIKIVAAIIITKKVKQSPLVRLNPRLMRLTGFKTLINVDSAFYQVM